MDATATRIIGTAAPLVTATAAILLIAVLAAPPLQSSRLPGMIATIAGGLAAYLLVRTGRPRHGALVLVATVFLAVAVNMTLNGGVRSHAYTSLIVLAALVGAVFGRRAILLYVLLVAALGGAFVYLDRTGVLPAAPPLSAAHAWVAVTILTLAACGLASIPALLLQEELSERDRRTAELAGAHAEARAEALAFRAVFDQSFQLMGLLTPDGIVRRANATALHMIGADARDVIGRPFPETPWWSDAQRAEIAAAIPRVAAGERVRMRAIHPGCEGREWIFDFSLSPFRDERGEVVFLIPEARDITDLVEAEARSHAGRSMESLGRLASGVAHDFNNVLMAITGAVDLLELRSRNADPEVAELIRIIRSSSRSAGELTAGLLRYAQQDPIELEPVDLGELLRSTGALLERALDSRIALRMETPPAPAVIMGSAGLLENALLNLGFNSRDAIVGGGTITLALRRAEVSGFEPGFHPAMLPRGSYWVIVVSDTGVGMDQQTQARLFEPFFTTKPAGKGTGLGLPSILGAVVQHQGAIRVESRPGAGAAIELFLPVSSEALATPKEDDPPVAGGMERLLVVEDEPAVREVVAQMLVQLGYRVTTAADGPEALRAFERTGFDLALVDMTMPGMNGAELAMALRREHPDLQIVLASGFSNHDIREAAREVSGVRLLHKPYRLDALSNAVSAALAPHRRTVTADA